MGPELNLNLRLTLLAVTNFVIFDLVGLFSSPYENMEIRLSFSVPVHSIFQLFFLQSNNPVGIVPSVARCYSISTVCGLCALSQVSFQLCRVCNCSTLCPCLELLERGRKPTKQRHSWQMRMCRASPSRQEPWNTKLQL